MKPSDYETKKKYHDLIGNPDFYAWCKRQSRNVKYDVIIYAYEEIEYPRRRPKDFEEILDVKVAVIYTRIKKYMKLAEQYEKEQNEKI